MFRIRREIRGGVIVRTAHSSVVLLTDDWARKLEVWPNRALCREFEKYQCAIKTWPTLEDILAPLRFRRELLSASLVMRRYRPIALDSTLEHAARLYAVMKTCGRPVPADFRIAASREIRAGVAALERLFGPQTAQLARARVEQCSGGECSLGFAHGDFHSRNIMLGDDGRARLIDLDCLRMDGIQQLDALNFALEAEWSRTGSLWLEQIPLYLQGQLPQTTRPIFEVFGVSPTADLAWLYLLDRLGQESLNYGIQYRPGQLKRAMQVLERSAA